MIKGYRLRELREKEGLTAQQLADSLNIAVSQVFRYEAEKTDPSSEVLIKMAKFFKVSVDYLVGLARYPDPPDPQVHADFDWPPATTDELFLLEHYRKHRYLNAIAIILEAYSEWKRKNKDYSFNFDDFDDVFDEGETSNDDGTDL